MASLDSRSGIGKLVARTLAGSWRSAAFPPLDLSTAELDVVTPLLYASGAASLAWRRIRTTSLATEPSGELLHQAYRLSSLQSAIHEERLEKLFRFLRRAGVKALLAKGWAAAHLYPDSALRPYGDFDLLIRPEQIKAAELLLAGPQLKDCSVDLHQQFVELDGRSLDELFERSHILPLGKEQVPVLSAEDHLALLCIHLLKHGAWRPLWLCDVGAMLESLPHAFAWDICLGSNAKKARWITSVLGLAHRLLQADISALPIADSADDIPTWLVDSVLKQWANPFVNNQPPMKHSLPMVSYVRRPWRIVSALRERWPNPILATISINGDLNDLPRLPYQIGNWAVRASQFVVELPAKARSDQM